MPTSLHIYGLIGILGASIYVIGDVLLLAPAVGRIRSNTAAHIDFHSMPEWRARAKLLHGLMLLPQQRLMWGGWLGVLAAPLTLAGVWQVYQGLQPAGPLLALPPAILWTYTTVVGAFVHGSFIHLGEIVQLANAAQDDTRRLALDVLARQRKLFQVGYAILLACSIAAAIWYAIAIAAGLTLFPAWMAVVNPVTATIAWLAIKRLLPAGAASYTDGAGFNIAYIVFFSFATFALW